MTKEELGNIIAFPEQAGNQHLSELLTLCQQYPYCAPLQSLVLVLLHKTNDLRFSGELHERALSLPNLRRLFFLLNTTPSSVTTVKASEPDDDNDGFGLIESFLEDYPDNSSDIELLFTPSAPKIEIEEEDEIISQFLKEGEKAETIEPLISNEKINEHPSGSAIDSSNNDDELFTETLARMYIRQGKFERANRILKQIYLEFPKKSGYFAEQLNFLEKLIKNNEVR